MNDADDEAREVAARKLPDWATDWVLLRVAETPQLGRPKGDSRIYVPTGIGHIANAARVRLEYRNSEDDEAKLRVQALLPPIEADGAKPTASVSAAPEVAVTVVTAAVAKPAKPLAAPRTAKPTKRVQGVRVQVVTNEALMRYNVDVELLSKRKFKDDAKAEREMAAALLERGGLRTVVLGRRWQEKLKRLAEEMPNFAGVIEHVRTRCTLAQITGRPLRIAPMLLVGMPGLGKTLFATQLAEALGVPQFVYALEGAETMSTLTGSD